MKKSRLFLYFFALMPAWALGQITFVLDSIPANTPANATIFLAGSFNAWSPNSPLHQLQIINNRYTITLPAAVVGSTIQYKLTRGSWATVESTAMGIDIGNRNLIYRNTDTVKITIKGWKDLLGGGSGSTHTALPNVQTYRTNFYMPQLNRTRRIWVYLPTNYTANTTQRYPVIYLQDGQNLFDNYTAFAGEWAVDETLARLETLGDAGVIVVGIDNGGSNRLLEYLPFVEPNYGNGQGNQYMDFIINTLKPNIDSNFRTLSNRQHTALGGSSLGGLIAFYGGIKHQDIFSKLFIFSPSFWISNKIYDHVQNTPKTQPMSIYLLAGGQESASLYSQINRMETTLLNAGFNQNEIKKVFKNDGQHAEWFWKREFKDAYNWLFSPTIGIGEQPLNININVFPNPFKDTLNINVEGLSKPIDLQIMNANGQTILQKNITQNQTQIDVCALPKGNYTLIFNQNNKIYSKTLIK